MAEVEPRLVTYNDKGQVEGVRYAQIRAVVINAIKEQQALMEQQQAQLKAQRRELDALKQALCAERPQASFCPPSKP